MPRFEKVLTVFVASPSDVDSERRVLRETIDELNLTWASRQALRFELIGWETHAFPGVGADPQDVINRQIKQPADIFIGIMWGRFGTPTPRAGSGTEEEFQAALTHHKAGGDVEIMLYFKDAPIHPSQIDPLQLGRVQDFQRGLGDQGVLHWTFEDTDKFSSLIRIHLTKLLQKHSDGTTQQVSALAGPIDATTTSNLAEQEEEELGLFDLSEEFEKQMAKVTAAGLQIVETISELNRDISPITREMDTATADPSTTRTEGRRLLDLAAETMDHATRQLRSELPDFDSGLSAGMAAAAGIGTLASSLPPEQVKEHRREIESLRDATRGGLDGIKAMRDSVSRLPRLTARLNKSRKALVSVLDEIIASLQEGIRLAEECMELFDIS